MAYPTLNSNEIYNALYNMIISQEIFPINVADPTLANKLRVDGTLYGDTKLYHSVDVTGSYDWENDAEASKLLQLNRNKSQATDAVVVDTFRQTNTTVDYYLSKRAFMTEGAFADFNGTLLSVLSANKRVYDNGIVNTFIGTHKSSAAGANIAIDMAGVTAPTTTADEEAYNRLTGQIIGRTFSKLARDLKDNRREFNELNYLRSVNIDNLLVVWNGDQHDNITKVDLPTIFHKDGIYANLTEMDLPSRYFGNVENVTTSTAESRALTELTIGANHYFPGDLIGAGQTVEAGSTYTADPTVVCKVFPIKAVPFMSAFTVGTSFVNARSLTENQYLTWGHNTLKALRELPFITITLPNA